MSRELKNKVVVITGGVDGIGFEIADKFLDKGAKETILLDIAEERGWEAAKHLCNKHGQNRAVFIKCDVTTDLETVSNIIFNKYNNVDVLVNNAGIFNEKMCKKTIDLNVTALIEWSLKFWEHMRTDKGGNGGTILNMASICGYRIMQFGPIYQASKFAVLGFTKCLGHTYHYNRAGVRVAAICPGFTSSKLTASFESWDCENTVKDFSEFLKEQLWQDLDSVGKAAVEVFERANSGSAWVIEGGKPISEI